MLSPQLDHDDVIHEERHLLRRGEVSEDGSMKRQKGRPLCPARAAVTARVCWLRSRCERKPDTLSCNSPTGAGKGRPTRIPELRRCLIAVRVCAALFYLDSLMELMFGLGRAFMERRAPGTRACVNKGQTTLLSRFPVTSNDVTPKFRSTAN